MIPPVGAVGGFTPPLPVAPVVGTTAGGSADAASGAASGAAGAGGGSFAGVLNRGLENLQSLQTKSDSLAVQASTGDLQDVHDYMIAATEASVATQLTVAVRDKAVNAFNEIMRMQM